MKKKFLLMMMLSLLFTAMGTSVLRAQSVEVSSYSELLNAVNDATVESIVVSENANITIPSGETLRVYCELTNNGNITVEGRLIVSTMVYVVSTENPYGNVYYDKTATKNGSIKENIPSNVEYEISLDGGLTWITDTYNGNAQAVTVSTDGTKAVSSSFQSAFTSAKTNEVVHLLKDVHVQSTNPKKNNGPLRSYYGLVLEGNGHTIFTDLESSGASNEYATIKFTSYLAGTGPEVNPVLKNVTIDSQKNAKADLDYVSGDVTFTVTMYNVNLLGNCQYASFSMKSPSMIINKSNVEFYDVKLPTWDAGSANKINIYSGEYAVSLDGLKDICTVYGGTFSKDVSGSGCLADGLQMEQDENGNYVVVIPPVAQIGDQTYTSLEEAFTAATEGQTITLLADATPTLTSQRAITKAAVIDLGGNTLTLTEDDLYFGTTTFQNGNIVVDPSVKPSTAVFWMFENQTLTFDNVKLTATGVTGTYLIGLDGNNSDLNIINGSEIIIENTTALDLDVICVNASTGNDIVVEDSKVNVTNLDGRVFFRGNYVIKGGSDINLAGITKAGFRIEAGQTLSIEGTSVVNIVGEPRDGGIHLTDITSTYTKAETATVNATVNEPVAVAKIGETKYATLQAAIDAVKDGETITLIDNVTVSVATAAYNDGTYVDGVRYTGDKSFTVDFNGKTVTDDGCVNDYLIYINNKGEKASEITFTNGTIVSKNGCWSAVCVNSSAATQNVELNLNGMNITNSNDAVYSGNPVVRARELATVNVNNGTTITSNGASYGVAANTDGSTININEGATIVQQNSGTTAGNSVFAAVGGKGVINIKGGTITSDKFGVHTMTTGTPVINISGGTITAHVALKSSTNGGNGELATINVTGGTINGKLETYTDNGKIVVSGGTFSEAVAQKYCAEGYVPVENADGTFGVEKAPVAKVGENTYRTFAEAAAAAQAGDEIKLLANIEGDITVPANVTLNGNGFAISGGIFAEGDITFAGVTTAADFDANVANTAVNIPAGASLQLTGSARLVIGHGATFNITGTIEDAKTADKATLVPSLKIAAGASITGNGVTFNVNNAYIVANANTTSKNNNADGTLDFNINNSIWEQTGVLAFYVPTSGKDPVVNFELKNSVLTTTSHLVFSVTKGEIVIDNSLVNQGTSRQIENRSTMTIKNGSVVNGAVATSSNAINPGTIIVENATYDVTGEFSGAAVGTGTLIIKKDANVSVGSIKAGANVVVDAEGMAAGDEINFTADLSQFTGTLSVINNDNLEASIVDGKIVLVVKPVAKIGDVEYATLEAAFAAATEGQTITLLADATPTLTSQRAITKAAVIDLGGKTLTLTEDDLYFGTTTFQNGNIVVDPSVKPSTAMFWMFENQTLTFDNVKLTATGVTGTYLIGLDGNNSDLNIINGSEIIIENTTALDLDVICVNASTGNDIVVEDSKVNVTNLDGRVFFRGNYTVKDSEVNLDGITKAGFRIEAGQTLSIEGTSVVNITGEPRDGGIHLTDLTATYTKAETATVNATVNEPKVAKVGENTYRTLALAVAAVEDGGTITLIANETFTENNRYNNGGWWDGLGYSGDKSFTINLDNFTISQDGALNDYLMWFKNDGAKANTITLKNGTLDAGTTAYSALATASSNAQKITVNLENIKVINNYDNGSTVKVRGGAELNVKDGTVITGKDSYLGIECIASTANIYDGAEIYMNGTSSYNGCLAGVGGNGTINVYGGEGQSKSGGFIAMTSGGTINVEGGEWTANTDGTYANSNKSVLVAQSDKQYNAGAGNSIVNVTGGTFKGGYNCYGNAAGDAQINIKGGNFNANPTSYVAEDYIAVENNGVWNVTKAAAKIGEQKFATLQAALNAAAQTEELTTIQLLAGTHTFGNVKFPATLKNVTIVGADNKATIIKGSKLYSADGNAVTYKGITFDGIVFDNSSILFTGARSGEVIYEDWTIKNCDFSDLQSTDGIAAIHFNLAADETIKNFTFENNTITNVTSPSNTASGLRLNYVTGNVVIKDNETNNVAFNAVQIINSEVDNFTFEGNILRSNGSSLANLYNVTGENIVITKNQFLANEDQESVSNIAYADVSGNYWGGGAPTDLPEGVVYSSYYTTVESDGTLGGLVELPQGNDFTGYTRGDAIWGEVWGNAKDSFVVKVLDANGNEMGTTSLNNIGGIIDGDVTVTWTLKLDAASNTDEYWTMNWTTAPTINNMPAKVELWVDGVKVSGGPVVLNAPDNLSMIYAAVTDNTGKILAYHTNVQEAIKAAAAVTGGARTTTAGTVEFLADVTVDKWIMFSETLSIGNGQIITIEKIEGLTIDGNNHKLTINSIESAGNGNRLFYDATNLNIKDLTINYGEGVAGGIGLKSGTISNVNFNGGVSAIYPGAGEVIITDCTFKTSGHCIYFEEERDNLVVTNNTFELPADANVILLRGDVTFTGNNVKSGRTVNVVSGSPVVTGNNFNDVRFKVYNAASATISENTINNLVFNETDVPTESTFTNNTLSPEAQAAIDALPAIAGEGTEANPYLINDVDDLVWLQEKVDELAQDGSTQFAGKYFKLTNDIDLNGINWNPIGTMSADHGSFKGVFDGGDHTISNLYVEQAGNGIGLFARTTGNAVIKNLKLNNVTVESTDNSNYVGGLVGNAYASTKIENVHVSGNVYISGRGYIGGIAGHGYVVMDNVSVDATGDGHGNTKGLITSTFWCAGGVLGYAGEGATNIMNAHVENVVVTSAAGGLGAIVGMAEDNNGTQPISGSNLSAENVEIKTYIGAYGDSYANHALGYLYGGNPTSILTGDLSVEEVTIETSTGEIPEVNDAVAKIGNSIYFNLKAALNAAVENETITLLRDIKIAEKTVIDNRTLTIDGNGKTLTYTGTDRAIDVPNDANANIDVTIKNLDVVATTANRGINYNDNGTLNVDNVTVTIGENVDGYAINFPGMADNAQVTIKDSKLTSRNPLNIWGENMVINVYDSEITSVDGSDTYNYAAIQLNNDNYGNVANGTVVNVYGGVLTATDEKGEPSNVVANATETGVVNISDETVVTGKVLDYVANIGGVYLGSLQAAVNAIEKYGYNSPIVIMKSFATSETATVKNGLNVTIDLNGKTITVTDETEKNFEAIKNQGTLTIKDSSADKTGKITVTATTNSGWNRYSAVIANTVGGKLTVDGGTLEHLGGTDMAYGIDNLTNGKGTYAETVINGGTIKSTYRGIRQFLNGTEAQNILTVNGGTIEGANNSIWMQDPNTYANSGALTVTEAAKLFGDVKLSVTAGSTEWPVEVSIAAVALQGESTVLTANLPVGVDVQNINGTYGNVNVVAQIGDVKYQTLHEAFDAAQDGDEIVVLKDIVLTEGITVAADDNMTLDLNGKTISMQDASGKAAYAIKNNGSLTIKDSAEGGKITFNSTTPDNSFGYATSTIGNGGKLTIMNGTIENTTVGGASYAVDGIWHTGEASLIINDGTIKATQIAVRQVPFSATAKNTVTINGGILTGATAGLQMFNINNEAKLSETIIKGGTFNGTYGFYTSFTSAQASELATINIDGGTFDGYVYLYNGNNGSNEYPMTVAITDGLFNSGAYIYTKDANDNEVPIKAITGGTFSVDPTDYCAPDYSPIFNGSTYTVIKTSGTFTRTLGSGWSWFSYYIDIEGSNGLDALKEDMGAACEQFKSQTAFTFYSNNKWYTGPNALTGTNVEDMYMVKMRESKEISLSGKLAVPGEKQITLKANGWTWIGYPLENSINVSDALATFNSIEGDYIKSKTLYAEYVKLSDGTYAWKGSLNSMIPGEGYKYKSVSGDEKEVYYSSASNRTAVKANVTSENNYWVASNSKYSSNMTVVAMMSIDNEIVNDSYEIAAFANGECRGSARAIYDEDLNAYMLYLTIHGEDVENITFKYYDVNYGTEYELGNVVVYSSDAILGSINNPYMFNLDILNVDEASINEVNVYPNPTTTNAEIDLNATCDKVEVFNALGVKVAEYSNVDSIDALETAGVYVIRVTIDGNVRNCRLVVK